MSGPTNPLATLRVVATNDAWRDPAIDMSDPDPASVPDGAPAPPTGEERLARYRETRDLTDLAWRPEMKPTIFVVERLPPVFISGSIDQMSQHPRHTYAFLAACRRVELPDGRAMVAKMSRDKVYKVTLATDDWINEVADAFCLETVYEVGRVAHQWAKMRAAERSPFWYPGG